MKGLRKTTTSMRKHVGGKVSPQVNDYLTLYSYVNGLDKSKIIRDVLTDWFHRQSNINPHPKLIRNLVRRLKKIQRTNGTEMMDFLNQLESDLKRKSINSQYSELILKSLQNEKDNENNDTSISAGEKTCNLPPAKEERI